MVEGDGAAVVERETAESTGMGCEPDGVGGRRREERDRKREGMLGRRREERDRKRERGS